MIGNKADLEKKRVVSYNEGADLARLYGFKFFESSIYQKQVMENTTNINNIFKELVRDIINLNKYGDDTKGSFSIENDKNSTSKIKDNQRKRCSC